MIFNLQSSIFNLQTRAGGPRYVRLNDFDLDRGIESDDGFNGRGRINLDPIGALPKKIVSPTEAAQSLAGGLTLEQLDQAAKFEVAEGVPIGIYYGRNLFALKLVSHLYESGVPRNTFTGLLGEGWGGLGRHGEWERVVKAWWAGQELTKRFDYTVWFDDRLPPVVGVLDPGLDGWNWVATNPTPYSGKYAHQSPVIAGTHYHQFSQASPGLAIGTGDTISCWVFLDPTNPPTEVMLQFWIGGDPEHRAYWGADSIPFGVNGTNSRRQISASVPATGQWVRLDVPASQVGLEGTTVDGMAFILFGGGATWDLVLKWKNDTSGNSGYIFRPGIIARDSSDIIQRQDITNWPSGLAFNGSAAVTVRLSTAQSAQDRPDAVKVLAECRRTSNYDATGAEIPEQYGYSPSPARAAADRFLFFFQRRFRERLDIAQDKFRRRIFWPSWVNLRDTSAALIPWDREGDGVNVFVPRFEFHDGLTGKTTLAQALDEICGQSATGWQDDGEVIIFVPPTWPPIPVHHFHPGNIVRPPRRSTESLDARPNRFIGYFRDVEGEFHEPASIEPRDDTPQHLLREDSINRVGEIRSEHAMGGMTFSQACRITEYIGRLLHDNPARVSLGGNATSMHVIPWDFVTVSHPELGWEYQLCLVREATLRSAEDSADECDFILQRIDGQLYEDAAHRPRQEALELEP